MATSLGALRKELADLAGQLPPSLQGLDTYAFASSSLDTFLAEDWSPSSLRHLRPTQTVAAAAASASSASSPARCRRSTFPHSTAAILASSSSPSASPLLQASSPSSSISASSSAASSSQPSSSSSSSRLKCPNCARSLKSQSGYTTHVRACKEAPQRAPDSPAPMIPSASLATSSSHQHPASISDILSSHTGASWDAIPMNALLSCDPLSSASSTSSSSSSSQPASASAISSVPSLPSVSPVAHRLCVRDAAIFGEFPMSDAFDLILCQNCSVPVMPNHLLAHMKKCRVRTSPSSSSTAPSVAATTTGAAARAANLLANPSGSASPDSNSSDVPLQRCEVPDICMESEDLLLGGPDADMATLVPDQQVEKMQQHLRVHPSSLLARNMKGGRANSNPLKMTVAPSLSDKPRKTRLYHKPCPTPGCDGQGHAHGKFKTHYTTAACPLLHHFRPDVTVPSEEVRAKLYSPTIALLHPVGNTEIFGGSPSPISSSCGDSSDPSLSASSPKDNPPDLILDPLSPDGEEDESLEVEMDVEEDEVVVVMSPRTRMDVSVEDLHDEVEQAQAPQEDQEDEEQEEQEEQEEPEEDEDEEYVVRGRRPTHPRRRPPAPAFKLGASVCVSSKCRRSDIAGMIGIVESAPPAFGRGSNVWYTVYIYSADGVLQNPLPVKVRSSDLTPCAKPLRINTNNSSSSSSGSSSGSSLAIRSRLS